MSQHNNSGSSAENRYLSGWCKLLVVINVISIYTMLALDRLPFLRRVHDDGIISLAERHDRFMDWINPVITSGLSNPYSLTDANANPSYGPLAYLLLRPISASVTRNALNIQPNASMNIVGIFTWVLLAATSILATALIITSIRQNMCTFGLLKNGFRCRIDPLCLTYVLLSYPTMFAFDRGNLDLAMLPVVAGYVYCIYKQSQSQDSLKYSLYWAGILLTIASCVKPYLLIFAIYNSYFLSLPATFKTFRKGFIWIMLIALSAFIVSIVSLALLSNGFPSIWDVINAQKSYYRIYVAGGGGDIWYLSPHTLFKKLIFRHYTLLSIDQYSAIYAFFSGIASILILRIAMALKAPLVVRSTIALSAIILAMLIFPSLSNEYKAVYVVIPALLGLSICQESYESISLQSRKLLKISLAFDLFVSLNRYSLMGDIRAVSAFSAFSLVVFTVIFVWYGFGRSQGRFPPGWRGGLRTMGTENSKILNT